MHIIYLYIILKLLFINICLLISVYKYDPTEIMTHTKLLNKLADEERSIAWLARQLKITRTYMHKMIHGRRNFSVQYKNQCAEVLGMNLKELFSE